MFTTVQCHHPLPEGASGSYTVSARLLVPAGAPLQASAGDTFLPEQPKPLKTWSMPMVAPSFSVGEVRVNLGWALAGRADVAAQRASVARERTNLIAVPLIL